MFEYHSSIPKESVIARVTQQCISTKSNEPRHTSLLRRDRVDRVQLSPTLEMSLPINKQEQCLPSFTWSLD